MESNDADSELIFLRRLVYRLNAALSKHQGSESLAFDESKHEVLSGDSINPPDWLTNPALLSPLMTSYEEHMISTVTEIASIKAKYEDCQTQLKDVIIENERLHSDLEECLQHKLDTLENTDNTGNQSGDATLRNLQAQLDQAHKEKNVAVDMNKDTMQMLDKICHERASEVARENSNKRIYEECKARNEKLESANVKMQITIEQLQSENNSLSYTATKQLNELQLYRDQLRESKQNIRDITSKEEKTRLTLGSLKTNLQNLTQDNTNLEHNYQASLNKIQQLENSMTDLESRHAQLLDICSEKNSEIERIRVQISGLEKINSEVDSKEISYLMQIRESAQLLDDALLARDSALVREKQCHLVLENNKVAMETLVSELGDRVKAEVEKVKLESSLKLRGIMGEVESLELDVSEARSSAERAKNAKQIMEAEFEALEKKYKEKKDDKKLEELQRRTLNAERSRDDAIITVQTLEDTLKRLKLSHSDEISRITTVNTNLDQAVQRLRKEMENCQHSRLMLTETLNQYKHDIQKLEAKSRFVKLEATKEFSLKQEALESECSGLEHKLRNAESSNRDVTRQLHKMLTDQQRITARWREEGKSSCEAYEEKICNLQQELNCVKRRCQHHINKMKISTTEHNNHSNEIPKLEESNRKLKAQLHETQYKLLSVTQRLGNVQGLQNSLTMNDLT